MRKSFVTVLCVIIGVIIAGIGAAVFISTLVDREVEAAQTISFPDAMEFHEGISVDGVNISGMTMEQAKRVLNRAHVFEDEKFTMTLTFDSLAFTLDYPDFVISYNTDEVLEEALKLGREGSSEWRDSEKARIAASGVRFSTEKTYALDDIGPVFTQIADALYLAPMDAQCRFDVNAPEKFVYDDEQKGRAADLERLETDINARLADNRFDEPVPIPVSELDAMVTKDQLKTKNGMISTFTSSFEEKALSGENREYNIKRAAEAINGVCVTPGEEFDMNARLGTRTGESGWKSASDIADDKYETQAGGGVGQASSTLYNAVMMADLEVTERMPHSWPPSYVPIGRDANISAEGTNFRFRNNKASPVYVVSYADLANKTVTAEIWGEPILDGVTIKLDSAKVETLARAGTRTEIDPSLGAGKKRVEREARTGSRAETYKDYYDRDGNLLRREVCAESEYRSIDGLVYVSAVPTKEQQSLNIPVSTPAPFPVIRSE